MSTKQFNKQYKWQKPGTMQESISSSLLCNLLFIKNMSSKSYGSNINIMQYYIALYLNLILLTCNTASNNNRNTSLFYFSNYPTILPTCTKVTALFEKSQAYINSLASSSNNGNKKFPTPQPTSNITWADPSSLNNNKTHFHSQFILQTKPCTVV